MYKQPIVLLLILNVIFGSCEEPKTNWITQSTSGQEILDTSKIWLTHEHTLVDFIGADSIDPTSWNHESILKEVLPFFNQLSDHDVKYFVDATPNYIGRDVLLLQKITDQTGIEIITNTGLYGARNNKYIPPFVFEMSAGEISNLWINEFRNGINGTSIKPGFIKIGIDRKDSLDSMHLKLAEAAALTHLQTGLTIASHTGIAKGLWPQLDKIKSIGVSPSAFIWVHAQQENDLSQYIKAAESNCWISFDGLGWETESHIEKLIFAKTNGILHKILVSHDAGWYDPQKKSQSIKPYTNLFEVVIPKLKSYGFNNKEIDLLLKVNPTKAFAIRVRTL